MTEIVGECGWQQNEETEWKVLLGHNMLVNI